MSAGSKQAMLVPPEYALAVADFLRTFEAVFGEADWEMTLDILQSDAVRHYIAPEGTFLSPGVSDESANWWNRGSLLASYRRLKAVCAMKGFNVVEIHPCGVVTKPRPVEPDNADDGVI